MYLDSLASSIFPVSLMFWMESQACKLYYIFVLSLYYNPEFIKYYSVEKRMISIKYNIKTKSRTMSTSTPQTTGVTPTPSPQKMDRFKDRILDAKYGIICFTE